MVKLLSGGGRIKSYSLLIKVNSGEMENGDSQDENEEPSAKKRKTKTEDGENRSVSAELVVYDKHSRCLLTEGSFMKLQY